MREKRTESARPSFEDEEEINVSDYSEWLKQRLYDLFLAYCEKGNLQGAKGILKALADPVDRKRGLRHLKTTMNS